MFRNRKCIVQMLDFDISENFLSCWKHSKVNIVTLMTSTQDRTINILISEFYWPRITLIKISCCPLSAFQNLTNLRLRLVPLFQISTTQYWTCNGPNRQFHVKRSADQRRWHRTLDSDRLDTADYEVRQKCSYCDLVFSYRPDNHTHRDKPRNTVHHVVSFRLDCFTVLRTG